MKREQFFRKGHLGAKALSQSSWAGIGQRAGGASITEHENAKRVSTWQGRVFSGGYDAYVSSLTRRNHEIRQWINGSLRRRLVFSKDGRTMRVFERSGKTGSMRFRFESEVSF